MADQAKAEKLAAAKRRVEQMKKKINANKEAGSDTVANPTHLNSSEINQTASSLKSTSQGDSTEEAQHINDSLFTQERSVEDEKQRAVLSVKSESNTSTKELFPISQSDELKQDLSHSADLALKGAESLTKLGSFQASDRTSPSDCFNSESITLTTNLYHNRPEKKNDVGIMKPAVPKGHELSITELPLISNSETEEMQQNSFQAASSLDVEIQLQTLREECEMQKAHSIELQQKADRFEKECYVLRVQLTNVENENHKLQHELEVLRTSQLQESKNQGSDQLENEREMKMVKKIQDLEREIFELRNNANLDHIHRPDGGISSDYTSPNSKFTEVDLDTHSFLPQDPGQNSKGRLGNLISSGFSAITGTNSGTIDEIISQDEIDFDEDAFRQAQEKQASDRIERIKVIKRTLKNWEGWRLDLVDARSLIKDNMGPIFDI
ncbi:hypothetical protein GcM3_049014 [Golovinomyces cichoracearum]|uniref:M protein repeat protein n=1 Tax=Golovinomyces cichoracearum TaxID=62708 RepID=A0A420IZY6_9PEZI|nr:hypothetical protein GcM3_049014 [Golovinomyces cichoracearum]